ncbi:BLUF domain-containing protein [Mucilaginibacter koreensis]
MIYYLIYISKAVQPMSEVQLADLLVQARTHNLAMGITGMLLYASRNSGNQPEGRFMQVIEGEEQAVAAVFASISKDNRHHEIQVLDEASANKRNFPTWSMGFKILAADEAALTSGYFNLNNSTEINRRLTGVHKPVNYLKSFYQINEQLR